jgi:hypothetical protein
MENLRLLAAWSAGEFRTNVMASDGGKVPARMFMVPVWKDRAPGEFWLYSEIAPEKAPGSPFRQRMYKYMKIGDNIYENLVFRLENEDELVIGHRLPSRGNVLRKLTDDRLIERRGCSVIFRRANADSFAGGTLGEGCMSDGDGGLYATSQIVVRENEFISWDRGFDRQGNQVWGATMGGNVFKKIKSFPI